MKYLNIFKGKLNGMKRNSLVFMFILKCKSNNDDESQIFDDFADKELVKVIFEFLPISFP